MKAQSSMEFLMFVSMSSLLLALMYGVVADRQTEISRAVVSNTATATADEFGFQVEMALVQGEGYSRNFTVPAEVGGERYEVGVGDGRVIVEGETDETVSTLYRGDWLNVSTEQTNSFRVKNNGSIWLERRQ